MLRIHAQTGLALCAALLLLAGCGDDKVSGPADYLTDMSFPLAVGNQWTYLEVSEEGRLAADSSYVTSMIVGTEEIDGRTYFTMIDSAHTGEIDPETTNLYEEGGVVYVDPGVTSELPEGQIGEWMAEVVGESAPWKFIDSKAAPGTSWTEYNATQTFDFMGAQAEISLSLTIDRLVDTGVNVPAGSWTAYCGAIHMRTTMTVEPGPFVSESISDQMIYLVDGVGLAMYDLEATSDFGDEPVQISETGMLTEYSLAE